MTHRILHHLTILALLLLCTTATTPAQTPTTLTGHWTGTLDTVHPDGSVDPDQLYLSLDSANPSASAAGNDPVHLSPAAQATLTGNTVTLMVPVNPTVTVQFHLTPGAPCPDSRTWVRHKVESVSIRLKSACPKSSGAR